MEIKFKLYIFYETGKQKWNYVLNGILRNQLEPTSESLEFHIDQIRITKELTFDLLRNARVDILLCLSQIIEQRIIG